MAIIDRIRANGGEVIREGYRFRLRKGRLSPEAVKWVRAHFAELCADIWPEFDAFEERAAIRQFCGGQTREEAEEAAYREVMGC
jgi:hypothetical protein